MMTPGNEAELAEAIAGASGPLAVQGGGTGGISVPGEVLSTSALTGVELYEPGALTLVARAGTPVAEVEALLASEGQRLAFEPWDARGLLGTGGAPTIGGVFAANASGPRRVQAGAARDFLLGVRFVDGAGTVVKNGGRVMKNVTGYDLVKLMAGSHGTLGVLSEVALKVLPAPECTGVVLINGLDDAAAVRAMAAALGSPYEVTGAAHTPAGIDGHPATMLRLEGFEGSVKYRAGELQKLLAGIGDSTVEMDPERTKAGWAWVRDAETFHGRAGNVWRLSVKPSDAPELVRQLQPEGVLYDWGGGLVWVLMPEDRDVRALMAGTKGHATLLRGRCSARFHPAPAPLAAISAGLRQKFDPRGILNTGLMG